MKKSILITGSTGFIGQNLTKLLLSLNYKDCDTVYHLFTFLTTKGDANIYQFENQNIPIKINNFYLLIIFLFSINCSSTNDKAFKKKILDYESSGSPSLALSLGAPSAAILFLTVDITNYLKFNLNKKEALELAKDLISWANDSIEQEFDWPTLEVQEDVHNGSKQAEFF